MPAAARIGDLHVCAHHRGGEIVSGCETVSIAGRPAARVEDVARCTGPEDDGIEEGCPTVLIGSQRAARRYDATDGGHIIGGEPTVLIGPSMSPTRVRTAARRVRRKRSS